MNAEKNKFMAIIET